MYIIIKQVCNSQLNRYNEISIQVTFSNFESCTGWLALYWHGFLLAQLIALMPT